MATDRLMATPWRFEHNKGNGNMLKLAQQEKIADYEKHQKKIDDQNHINDNMFKIAWANKFDDVNDRCRAKLHSHSNNEELKLVRKANMKVRQDALKKLLSRENQIYESELNKKGLCVHREFI